MLFFTMQEGWVLFAWEKNVWLFDTGLLIIVFFAPLGFYDWESFHMDESLKQAVIETMT